MSADATTTGTPGADSGGAGADRPGGDVDIVDKASARRYELRVDGDLAGLLDYRVEGDTDDGPVTFVHAEVYPRFEKRGLGKRLVKFALDDVIGDGKQFVPQCPFVVYFVEQNPSYAEHVAG